MRPPVLGSGFRDSTRTGDFDRRPASSQGRDLECTGCSGSPRGPQDEESNRMTDIQENAVHEATATIDNGRFGTRTVRFEAGRLARQAAGSVVAYLDDETMLLSATTASKQPEGALRLLPADGGRRGAHVRGGPDPRLVLPPRGPAVHRRDPHRPADRPAAAPVLRGRPAQRDPDRRHGPVAEPGGRLRRRRDQRGVRLHATVRPAVLRPDRRRPRRPDRRPVGRLPDPRAVQARGVRHRHRRPRRR